MEIKEIDGLKISYDKDSKENKKQAKVDLKAALSRYKGGDAKESLAIADCYCKLGKYKKAVPFYEAYLNGNFYIETGRAYKALGDIFFNGMGVKADIEKGLKYYTEGAKYDHKLKKFLGDIYYNGKGVPVSHERAYAFYKNILDTHPDLLPFCAKYAREHNEYGAVTLNERIMENDVEAKLFVADYYIKYNTNLEGAINIYEELVKCGEWRAFVPYAKMLFHGKGCQVNYKKAFTTLKKAADNGINDAWSYLGECYYFGKGTKQNKELGIACYKKTPSAEQSEYMLARIDYEKSKSSFIDYNLEKIEKSASSSPEAATYVAMLVRKETKGLRYHHNLENLCKFATQNNIPEGYLERGYLNLKNKLFKEAFADFKKAQELGVAEASAPLAKCYREGIGVRANEKKALELIDSATDDDTLYYKARCLLDEKKDAEAKELLKQVKGIPEALYKLGMLHKKDKEFKEAFDAFSKCYTSDEKAKSEYVKALFYGIGTLKNERGAMLIAKDMKKLDGELNYLLGISYDKGGAFGNSFELAKKHYYASAKLKYKKAMDIVAKIEADEAARKAKEEEERKREEERKKILAEIEAKLKEKYKNHVIRIPSIKFEFATVKYGICASGELTFNFDLSYYKTEATVTAEGRLDAWYQSDSTLETLKNNILEYMNDHLEAFFRENPDYPFKVTLKTNFTVWNRY